MGFDRVSDISFGSSNDLKVYNDNASKGLDFMGFDVAFTRMPNECPNWYYQDNNRCRNSGGCDIIHRDKQRVVIRRKGTDQVFAFQFWGTPHHNDTAGPKHYAVIKILYDVYSQTKNRTIDHNWIMQSVLGWRDNDHNRKVVRSIVEFVQNIRSFFTATELGQIERLAAGRTIHV